MSINLIFTIAGIAALIVVILVFLFVRRKKKKNKLQKPQVPVVTQQNAASKYNGREASEEELESASGLELVNFEDGLNTLALRFTVKGGVIQIDDIEPYDNDWGTIHNHHEIIGKKRHHGQRLRLFYNKRKRKKVGNKEAFNINIVYRDSAGVQWMQPLRYHSIKGIKVKDVQVLGDHNPG